jgi:hypothetical protein
MSLTDHYHIREQPGDINAERHIGDHFLDYIPFALHIPFHVDILEKLWFGVRY